MTKKTPDSDEIRLLVSKETKKWLQRYCLDRDTNMSEVLRGYINRLQEGGEEGEHRAMNFIASLLDGKRPNNADVVKLAHALDCSEEKLIELSNKVVNGNGKSCNTH
ncbi:MAG: hypothetical protein LRZ84_16465 [Desertifilum sp.]|nr:hypothetical protein [Desertifilum sp.]